MHCVAKGQCVQLIVCVGKRLATYLHKLLKEISVFLHDVENLTERNRNDFGSLESNRSVPTLLPRGAKLPHNIACFANIVDELVPILSDASNLHEPLLDKEQHLLFVADIV